MRQTIWPTWVARSLFFAGTITICTASQLALAQEINAGLWEMRAQIGSPEESNRLTEKMALIQAQLKNMSPAVRQMVEQQLASMGASISLDDNAITVRTCISPEEAKAGPMHEGRQDDRCTYTQVQQNGNTWHGEVTCTKPETSGRFKTVLHSRDHHSTEAKLKDATLGVLTMTTEAHRLSDDCGNLKARGMPVAKASNNTPPPVAPTVHDPDGTSSAACFNPDLFKAGTHYRKHLKAATNNGVIFEYTIKDNASFNGADGLISAHGFMNMLTAPGVMGTSNPIVDYFQLEQTAEGPVYYKHGGTLQHENSRIGKQPPAETVTLYQPPEEFGLFALQPGKEHSFHGSRQSARNGQATQSPAASKVRYVGREDVTTTVGTFSTCHFVVNNSDHYYIVGMGLPLRLGKTELQADSHVNGVPLKAWAK